MGIAPINKSFLMFIKASFNIIGYACVIATIRALQYVNIIAFHFIFKGMVCHELIRLRQAQPDIAYYITSPRGCRMSPWQAFHIVALSLPKRASCDK